MTTGVVANACGGSGSDGVDSDGGCVGARCTEAGTPNPDSGSPIPDSGMRPDAPSPDGGPPPDAGSDADAGVATEAGPESGVDAAPPDAGLDAGLDAGQDSGPLPDSGPVFPGVSPRARLLGAAFGTSFALTSAGELYTWGSNEHGLLATGTPQQPAARDGNATVPIRPPGTEATTFSAVSAGDDHGMALDDSGNVWAWGDNAFGQVGNDDQGNEARTPVMLVGPTGLVDIDGGRFHTVTVDGQGALWAWGANGGGQLGVNDLVDRALPVQVDVSQVPTGLAFATVEGGADHSLALAEDGTVWVFGSDRSALGRDGEAQVTTVVPVFGPSGAGTQLSGIVAIAAGLHHNLALDQNGDLWAWGRGDRGQLGRGVLGHVQLPGLVDTSAFGSRQIQAIRAGGEQSYAILDDGTLWAWGADEFDQLGLGGGSDQTLPVQVTIPMGVADMEAFQDHGVARAANGAFWAWGTGDEGQIGQGLEADETTPVATYGPFGLTVTGVFPARAAHSFVRMSDGSVWSVGARSDLNGNVASGATPILNGVFNGMDVRMIAGSELHTLVLENDGTVWAFGSNANGQLGDGSNNPSTVPVAVDLSALPGGVTIEWIGVGIALSVALDSNGNVWTWGLGRYGHLGIGGFTDSNVPVQVQDNTGSAALSNIVEVVTGEDHLLARDTNGIVYSWGLATDGQLGSTPQDTCASGNSCNQLPRRVCNIGADPTTCTATQDFLGAVNQLAAGESYSAVRIGGQVYAFGWRDFGELGDGMGGGADQRTPAVVMNATNTGPLTGVTHIVGGHRTVYAFGPGGSVLAWGRNSQGELGQDPSGTTCGTLEPCLDLPATIAALAGVTPADLRPGEVQVMLLDDTGTAWGWGENESGETGTPTQDPTVGFGVAAFTPTPLFLLPR